MPIDHGTNVMIATIILWLLSIASVNAHICESYTTPFWAGYRLLSASYEQRYSRLLCGVSTSLPNPSHTIIDLYRPSSTIPLISGGFTATSVTHPIPEIYSFCPPGDQQLQSWPVIKAPLHTVHLRMGASVSGRITTPARDPQFRSFTVSLSLFHPRAPR